MVNDLVYAPGLTPEQQMSGWHESWAIFAGYALVVAVLFWIVFKENESNKMPTETVPAGANQNAGGMVED